MESTGRARLPCWLAAEAEAAGQPIPQPFDPRDDRHLEAAAGALLERFRRQDDVGAFGFLFELCQARLRSLGALIVRRLALALDPEDLVAGFLARLFADPRRDQPVVRRFLALAYTAMRFDALNQLRLDRRARQRGASWEARASAERAPPDPVRILEAAEGEAALPRLGTLFLSLVGECFHRLPPRDRRVLHLREVDGLSYDALAAELRAPRSQVGMILKRARARLARRIEAALRHAGPGAPPSIASSRARPARGRRALIGSAL